MSGRMRNVVVSEDYLDGIVGMSVEPPSDFDREVRALPVDLLRAHDEAVRALKAAEDAIRVAWAAATPRRNRKYAYAEFDNAE